MSNTDGTWGSGDLPPSQDGPDPSGMYTGDNALGSVFGAGEEGNPGVILPAQLPAQPGMSTFPVPQSSEMMRVTLLIPEDKYEDWKSGLPTYVKIRETKVLGPNNSNFFEW